MKKPRADSILLNLPEEQQAQLADWLLSGVPYHQAREMVAKDFKVEVRSLNAFSKFWQSVCAPHLLSRRARAVETADAVAAEAAKTPGRFDQATIDALKQKAFEQAISPGADPKAVRAIFSLVLKARDQDLDAQQIQLDRDKFEFDAVEKAMEHAEFIKTTKANPKLSQAEKISAIRQRLFGVLP
jgi:hypothetical protein